MYTFVVKNLPFAKKRCISITKYRSYTVDSVSQGLRQNQYRSIGKFKMYTFGPIFVDLRRKQCSGIELYRVLKNVYFARKKNFFLKFVYFYAKKLPFRRKADYKYNEV